jgi:hypothetical protein
VLGPEPGNSAYFGRDVLRGLITGIDDFIHLRQPRWKQFRSLGPVLLGSAMWIDDGELIAKLGELAGACIVVRKQARPRRPERMEELKQLEDVNQRTPGLPTGAFPDLAMLAPKVSGSPLVVGPGTPSWESVVPPIRTLGYRRVGDHLVPIVHAKLALLGSLWWHDEHPAGYPDDFIGFTPRRLWVSSANFTRSSRRNLEFGYWTEDPALLDGAERFLLNLIANSEGVDPDAAEPAPDLAPVDFDDGAFAEYFAEFGSSEYDDEFET